MIRFKLNSKGVRNLLKRQELADICTGYANRIRQTAGEGYEVSERRYPERTGAAVYPATEEAYYDNLSHNTLEKARRSV